MTHFCFFFFQNNDIDHMLPVAWKLAHAGHEVTTVLLSAGYNWKTDPRLKLIERTTGRRPEYAWEFMGSWVYKGLFSERTAQNGPTFFQKLLNKCGITKRVTTGAIRRRKIESCVFEYGDGGARNREPFVSAAMAMGLPMHCLPHGMHMFPNTHYNPVAARAFKNKERPFSGLNIYDSVVSQSRYHGRQIIRLGINGSRVFVLGSARFCPEWMAVNTRLFPPYQAQEDDSNKTRCVFMLPHWDYEIERRAVISLIERLTVCEGIYLVVKDHPRGSGGLSDEERLIVERSKNADYATNVQSVSLIRWADAVINVSSSIGLEVIGQGKLLINPAYLHGTETILEKSDAGSVAQSEDEVIDMLIGERDVGSVKDNAAAGRLLITRTLVYGQSEAFDVLGAHVEFLTGASSPLPLGSIDEAEDEVITDENNALKNPVDDWVRVEPGIPNL